MRALLASLALAALSASPALASPPPPATSSEDQVDPLAKKITGSTAYVPTFGLRVTIARGMYIKGNLSVDAGLDIPDKKMRKKAVATMPRLRSTLLEALQGYASLTYAAGDKPDADMLLVRLQKAVDSVLGKDVATVTLASVIVFSD